MCYCPAEKKEDAMKKIGRKQERRENGYLPSYWDVATICPSPNLSLRILPRLEIHLILESEVLIYLIWLYKNKDGSIGDVIIIYFAYPTFSR
jgi:hypothetical protein